VPANAVPVLVPSWHRSCCLARFKVELLLTKYLWLVDGLVVAICAGVLGSSASSLVAYQFGEAARPIPPVAKARPSSSTPARKKRPDTILRRNIFCSTCPPIRLDGEPAPEASVDMTPSAPQPTQLPLKLLAVMHAPTREAWKWNTAIIRDGEQQTVGAFRAGAEIHNATLVSIEETRVYLANDGTTEYLDLLAPQKPVAPAPARPVPLAAQPTDAFSQELDRGIKRLGEHRYEIQRGTLETVLGNLALLSRSARIIPEVRGGKSTGFRLFAVRPDGPFAKVGLQNGDVIVSMNGLEMTSPEKALEVYGKLKSATHLDLGLERNGHKVAADYTIR